jgi:hypothetical protein
MIERSQSAYRAICGIVSLAKKYPHEIVNQACRKVWKRVFSIITLSKKRRKRFWFRNELSRNSIHSGE